ncbi:VolA/Pla-1 family phospholipase [Paraglaciecola sp. MB-3u-78]|uniref:VolA/Pla-1 family phospholipase n=1 Tax=Paraglaciecola sp. MB-3u-78 TaxID=2058332 RepID=UPI000C34403A|nr:VolA/Pla-1 family phospholipase [Paraglaciecola sp. MB-3u-78]PKG99647.1 lipase [Paraglaciecola sp. MB-3u-78]
MKKSLLSLSIITLVGLSGCLGGNTPELTTVEEAEEVVLEEPYVRVVFNPATGDLNIPNDFLMIPNGNFFDFTLNTEGEETFDSGNPQHALSALDGWSTQYPFSIRVSLPEGMDIDPSSVSASSIRIFEATQALEGDSAVCQTLAAEIGAPGVPCDLGEEVEYGVDFVASYTPGSGAISVVPLKPFKSSQGYMLVVTDDLTAMDGRIVKGSITWELARQNINTNPLGSADLLQLQGLVNSLVNVLQPAGLETNDISYAAYFSTQSVGDVVSTVKKINIASYAQTYAGAFEQALARGAELATADQMAKTFASQYLPNINTVLPDSAANAFEALAPILLPATDLAALTAVGLNTCSGLMAAITAGSGSPLFETASETFAIAGPYCVTSIVSGDVDLPYYLSTTAPLTDWWKAACTSGATLQALGEENVTNLLVAGQVGANNDYCQLVSQRQLYDLDLTSLGMDDPRNLTKVNPIPLAKGRQIDDISTLYNEAGTESVAVQFTVPDESVIATLSAVTGGAIPAITKPESGWPVVVFMHGITGGKENVLALSAALSLGGFATASIDHPLHGERGFILDDGTVVNASSPSLTDYLNFSSLLTGRDNSRQSIADILAFRLSLNAIIDTTGLVDLDLSKVHFISHSLGSITGIGALAIANQTLGDELAAFDGMYAFSNAALNVPAGGVPSFILESADFGPLVRGSLLAASSEEFAAFLATFATANGLSLEDAIRPAFIAFEQAISAEQLAAINATFSAFGFAAQTALDSADPVNYAQSLSETTGLLVQLLVGGGVNDDGSVGLPDQVNPVVTSLPLAGGQPLVDLMGLSKVSQTSNGSGVVYFNTGDHFSLFSPAASADVTEEMHAQAVSFFASDGQSIVIAPDTIVVEQ